MPIDDLTTPVVGEPCFECGGPAQSTHHVVPRSRGGTRAVPLCAECHAKAHHHDGNMSGSSITRDALAAAKARGVLLGASNPRCRNLTEESRRKGIERSAVVRVAKAVESMADVTPILAAMKQEGRSLREIADRLNRDGVPARRGGLWSQVQVKRVLDRHNRYNHT